MPKAFLGGILFSACAALALGYFVVATGRIPANADSPPPAAEKWVARTALRATLAREAPKGPNPQPFDDANLLAGIKLYAMNCAVCHGASDGQASNIGKGLYQRPPQLASDGVEDDPEGYTYWKIRHGLRMTGMPGFSGTLSDAQIWQLTLFLKHMDALTPAAQRAWKAVPSVKVM